ncbi:hypothetical protein CJI97_000731 [Candidozyma auris]|nr:hypothetical protein CJI97_000731 [[Candida] auris]
MSNRKKIRSRMQPMENSQQPSVAALKSDSLRLHDEADLINFRADAFARFISNQDLLETVASKPFHTSKITPPSVFPIHKKKLYEEDATDEQLREKLRNLDKEDFIFGDTRLMKVKEKMLKEEIEENEKELAEMKQHPHKTFTEEMAFQKKASTKLAKLFSECSDAQSLEVLEKAMDEIVKDYKEKHGKNYILQHETHTKRSIPIEQIAPDVKVEKAPANYNPRSITSFVDMGGRSGTNGRQLGEGPEAFRDDLFGAGEKMHNHEQLPFMQGNGDEDFAMTMMNENGSGEGEQKSPPTSTQGPPPQPQPQPQPQQQPPPTAQSSNEQSNNQGGEGDVNMEDLNQFLQDPQGNDDMMGDDMDALMNFGPDNEEGGGMIEDDAFNSDFLSQIDHTME